MTTNQYHQITVNDLLEKIIEVSTKKGQFEAIYQSIGWDVILPNGDKITDRIAAHQSEIDRLRVEINDKIIDIVVEWVAK
jgi:uncharacterized small protein (DUF1192 family)